METKQDRKFKVVWNMKDGSKVEDENKFNTEQEAETYAHLEQQQMEGENVKGYKVEQETEIEQALRQIKQILNNIGFKRVSNSYQNGEEGQAYINKDLDFISLTHNQVMDSEDLESYLEIENIEITEQEKEDFITDTEGHPGEEELTEMKLKKALKKFKEI